MKKLIAFVFALTTVISLSACGTKTEDVTSDPKATSQAQITTTQEETTTEATTVATTTTKETTTEANKPVLTNLSSLSDEELAKLFGTLCDKDQYPESCIDLEINTDEMSQKEIDETREKMREHNDTRKIEENIALFWTEKGVDINASSYKGGIDINHLDKYEFKYDCIVCNSIAAPYSHNIMCPQKGLFVEDEKRAKHICELLDATFFKPYALERFYDSPEFFTKSGKYGNLQNGSIYGICHYDVKEDYDGSPYYIIRLELDENQYYNYRKTSAQ